MTAPLVVRPSLKPPLRRKGDLLSFSAVVARAEINKNGDEITAEGIRQLASTLPGMAVTYDDHRNPRKVCGYFAEAWTAENDTVLWARGIVWASRFPELVAEIYSGQRRLSIEAHVDESTCLDCGAIYAGSGSPPCEHLIGSQRRRRVAGLAAYGACLLTNPAGTDTHIAPDSLQLVAAQLDELTDLDMTDLQGITAKPEGHRSKPSEYANVPDHLFADPVNYKYPLDREHIRAALSYLSKESNRTAGGYTEEEWRRMKAKAARYARQYGIELREFAAGLIIKRKDAHMEISCLACGETADRADLVPASELIAAQNARSELDAQLAAIAVEKARLESELAAQRAEYDRLKADIETERVIAARQTELVAMFGPEFTENMKPVWSRLEEDSYTRYRDSLREIKSQIAQPPPLKGSLGASVHEPEPLTAAGPQTFQGWDSVFGRPVTQE